MPDIWPNVPDKVPNLPFNNRKIEFSHQSFISIASKVVWMSKKNSILRQYTKGSAFRPDIRPNLPLEQSKNVISRPDFHFLIVQGVNLGKYLAIKRNLRQFTGGLAFGKGLPKVRLRPKVWHFALAGGPAPAGGRKSTFVLTLILGGDAMQLILRTESA